MEDVKGKKVKKLPKLNDYKDFSIYIGGLKWRVKFVRELSIPNNNNEPILLNGLSDPDHLEIKLHTNMIPEVILVTFWHEVNHSALSNISSTGNLDEEHVVEIIARAQCEIFRQRKHLPAWIFEG